MSCGSCGSGRGCSCSDSDNDVQISGPCNAGSNNLACASSCISPTVVAAGFFGASSVDFVVPVSTPTTPWVLTSDMVVRNLTVPANSYLATNGFTIRVSGVLDISQASPGAITGAGSDGLTSDWNGGNGSGGTGGLAATPVLAGPLDVVDSSAGAAGGTGAGVPSTNTTEMGTNPMYAGGKVLLAGRGGNSTNAGGAPVALYAATPFVDATFATTFPGIFGGLGGQGGSSGGGDGTNAGGGGGGGGAGGPSIVIFAHTIVFSNETSAVIVAKGGSGGNGGNGVAGTAAGGGAGAPGGGGWVLLGYEFLNPTSLPANLAIDVSGGAGGNGGNAFAAPGTGGFGSAGANGGTITLVDLCAGTITNIPGLASLLAPSELGPVGPTGGTGSAGGLSGSATLTSFTPDPCLATCVPNPCSAGMIPSGPTPPTLGASDAAAVVTTTTTTTSAGTTTTTTTRSSGVTVNSPAAAGTTTFVNGFVPPT